MDNGVHPSSPARPGGFIAAALGGTVLTFATCPRASFIFCVL